jgi:hypothetical protein
MRSGGLRNSRGSRVPVERKSVIKLGSNSAMVRVSKRLTLKCTLPRGCCHPAFTAAGPENGASS